MFEEMAAHNLYFEYLSTSPTLAPEFVCPASAQTEKERTRSVVLQRDLRERAKHLEEEIKEKDEEIKIIALLSEQMDCIFFCRVRSCSIRLSRIVA
jgi:hypothetical protein